MAATALQVFVLQDGQLLASEVFSEGTFLIGSDTGSDLVLQDEIISPQHVALQFRDGVVTLIDQGGPIGTIVNGQPIAEAVVTSADDIHVGPYLLKIRQLAKKKSAPQQLSGIAGPPPPARAVARSGTASAARVSSPLMPTPRPGGLAAPLARAMSAEGAPAQVIPLRPARILEPDVDVDALVDALDRPATPPPKPLPSSVPTPLTVPLAPHTPTLRDASYFEVAEQTPLAAPLWVEIPETPDEGLEEVPVEEEQASVFEDLSEIELPRSAPAAVIHESVVVPPDPRPVIPGMVPAPSFPPKQAEEKAPPARPAPVDAKAPPARPVPVMAPSAPAPAKAPEQRPSKGPERLRVRVLWGRHVLAVRSFKPGETVVAAPGESAALPLYGFSLSGETVLATPANNGWQVKAPRDARVSVRDSSGRWQPASASVADGLPIPLFAVVRLSSGDVHVEIRRELVPVAPKVSFGHRDWAFLSILLVLLVGGAVFVKKLPDVPREVPHEDVKAVEKYVRAMVERHKKPDPPKKKEQPKATAAKPPPVKPIAQATTLAAATTSLKAVDQVASATKQIDNLMAGLNKVTSLTKGSKGGVAGLGSIPTLPSLGNLGTSGGGIGDLNGTGGPLTKGGSALAGAGGLGSGTAGHGQVRGVPVSVPKKPSQVQGQIDRDALARVINEHVNEMRNCYERALLRDPNVGAGKITLEWTIGGNGSVTEIGTKNSTLKSAEVVSCVLDVVRGLHFPKPEGGVVIVSYPILFNSVGY